MMIMTHSVQYFVWTRASPSASSASRSRPWSPASCWSSWSDLAAERAFRWQFYLRFLRFQQLSSYLDWSSWPKIQQEWYTHSHLSLWLVSASRLHCGPPFWSRPPAAVCCGTWAALPGECSLAWPCGPFAKSHRVFGWQWWKLHLEMIRLGEHARYKEACHFEPEHGYLQLGNPFRWEDTCKSTWLTGWTSEWLEWDTAVRCPQYLRNVGVRIREISTNLVFDLHGGSLNKELFIIELWHSSGIQ